MSESRDHLVEQLDCYSGTMLDIDSDIIDISSINFGNHDTWLQTSIENPSEYSVDDLYAWLRSDVEQDCNDSHGNDDNRRSIDTRTFTRPKKRLGRSSFESIVEVTSPLASDVWKPRTSPSIGTREDNDDAQSYGEKRDSTPSMLRLSNPGIDGLCSTDTALTSGQESLEAFLNMSQSKGIDSFINLAEPEFSDAVMNISQPSLLYSSMMSITRDDLSQTINQSSTINQSQIIHRTSNEDSQILTESMMQSSMFGDVADVNFNDTFAKNSANVTVVENTSFCNSDDRTFVAAPIAYLKEPLNGIFNSTDMLSVDATYLPKKLDATLTEDLTWSNDPHASYIINHKCQIPDAKFTVNDTSFVLRKDTLNDISFVVRSEKVDASYVITSDRNIEKDATYKLDIPQPGDLNDTFNVENCDAAFVNTSSLSPRKSPINSTFKAPGVWNDRLSMKLNVPNAVDKNETFNVQHFDAIFEKTPSSPRKSSVNSTFKVAEATSDKISMKLNVPNAVDKNETFNVQHFDAIFEKTPSSPRKSSVNSTFKVAEATSDKISMKLNVPNAVDKNETFNVQHFDAIFEKTPSSPRKSSVNSTFKVAEATSDKISMKLNVPNTLDKNDSFEVQNFDATCEKTPSLSPRKSSINSTFKAPTAPSDVPSMTNDHTINAKLKAPTRTKMDTAYEHNPEDYCNDVPLTNRYNTYRKASAPVHTRNENYATNNLTVKLSNETVNIGASLENLDATFGKPSLKIPRKLHAPQALSRLPQSLQKSNPNLISNSLKTANTVGRSAIPNFGFSKLARPSAARNVESSLTSKLYGLGKMKSESEQRLEVTRNVTDFQITGTGGSTESIESTQSTHSAPDFDDRLSVCSDSSHTSYSMRTMNIENLQKVTRMREDYLKPISTPKPSRRVLENTWVEDTDDLPSPILKNGPETYGNRGSLPRNTNSEVKTSSPFLSPVGSLQNLTINVTKSINDNNAEETKLLAPRNEHITTKRISEATVKSARSAGENRTGLRPPGSWSSSNQRPASGIPRPASRIPAPRSLRPVTKLNQGDIKKGCL